MSLIDDFAAAIQQMEGWFPGSVAYRNNNPGNLRAGKGQIGTSNGYAVFPDYQTGLDALKNQIQLNISKGLTTQEFFAGKSGVYPGYAPAADSNQPNVYANFVAGKLGIDPNVPLTQVVGNMPVSGGGSQTSAGSSFSDVVDSIVQDFTPTPTPNVDGTVDTSSVDPPVGWILGGVILVGLVYVIVGR